MPPGPAPVSPSSPGEPGGRGARWAGGQVGRDPFLTARPRIDGGNNDDFYYSQAQVGMRAEARNKRNLRITCLTVPPDPPASAGERSTVEGKPEERSPGAPEEEAAPGAGSPGPPTLQAPVINTSAGLINSAPGDKPFASFLGTSSLKCLVSGKWCCMSSY